MRSGHAPTLTATIPAVALLATPPSAPVVVSPAAHEISFGRVIGQVAAGTTRVVVSVEGRVVASKDVGRTRFDFAVPLPARDVQLTVSALDERGRGASTTIGPVFSLPATAEPRRPPRRSVEDPKLARSARWRGRSPASAASTCKTCAPAAQPRNAGARFPAASTVKVAIAIEVLRRLGGKPPRGSRIDALLRKAIIPSDDRAANDLLTWLGGSRRRRGLREPALPRARHGRHGHVRRLHHHAGPDPDPRGRSTELRRQADDGGRPRDAHALAEPRRGRAGPAGSAWLPAVAGASSSTCSRTRR